MQVILLPAVMYFSAAHGLGYVSCVKFKKLLKILYCRSNGRVRALSNNRRSSTIWMIIRDVVLLYRKSYMRKGFLICEEMRKYLTIYEEAVR
jgi:hypothetical protein